ncbi:hypothetical protein ACOSQ4_009970 [Xanthoceras sorbifolium]
MSFCGFIEEVMGTITVAQVAGDQGERMENVDGMEIGSIFLAHKDLLEYEHEVEEREENARKHRNELEEYREELEAAKKEA